ncbi:MAG: 16S rRNA (guanine(527)-N(7))-methyltransferase RsmG [Bacteroidia bacterium]
MKITRYFPGLTDKQQQQLQTLETGIKEWNEKINLISRKDIENLMERHILHSLAIARIISFKGGTTIMDVGTGGGFPGLPLAILFPGSHFLLVDSIGKKVKVAKDLVARLELGNVEVAQTRVEQVEDEFDFITGRAVTRLPEFCNLVRDKIITASFNHLYNGVLYLKGGDLSDELRALPKRARVMVYPISDYFDEEYFQTKNVVHVAL